MDARFDPTTRQKVDDLAKRFRRPCSAVLCHSMQWGLRYERIGGLDQGESQDPMRHLYLYVAPDLHERLEKAASAAGLKTVPRHPSDAVSQRKRTRVEEIFGWMKAVELLRKVRHRGVAWVGRMFTFAAAVCNLVRMRQLAAEA
jgi:predicted transcriptional regulator